jgi:hypothetical protein
MSGVERATAVGIEHHSQMPTGVNDTDKPLSKCEA